MICEAVSGLRHLTGDPDRAPSRVGVSMTDYITGLHGAFGAVMALMAREKTGRGQVIDAALYESAFNFMEAWIPAYEKLGFVPDRTGSRLIGSTPNNLYPTADGSYIHITAMADSLFRRLCGAMGQPELADDPRFAEPQRAQRATTRRSTRSSRDWTRQHALADLEAKLDERRGAGDAHLHDRGHLQRSRTTRRAQSIVEAPDQHLGTVAMAGRRAAPVGHAGRRAPCRPRHRPGHARACCASCSAWTTRDIDALTQTA